MINNNIIIMTDSYKVSHVKGYRPETAVIYSYLEARKGGEYKEMLFFGLQYLIKRYLSGKVVTKKKIDKAEKFWNEHFGSADVFDRTLWEHILEKHDGKLPIKIKAVKEGSVIPESNVLLSIENTCPECYWLTNYIETLIVENWYGCTAGTISREMKKDLMQGLVISGTATYENINFKLHDFGFRGATSPESAAIGGSAHLVNFRGTDTPVACELLMEYYNCSMPGFSIPATEHSVITSWGRKKEKDVFKRLLKEFPNGTLAMVSDSWDIRNAVEHIWGEELKEKVLARDGILVIRPDSGDPKILLPELLETLGKKFGFYVNEKGYKVLNDKVRLIQGDGIKRHTLKGIIKSIIESGWSLDCVNFGSGGGLMQDCNRDTQRIALKCSYTELKDGSSIDVFKCPITDPSKASKKGKLMLIKTEKGYNTVPEKDNLDKYENQLVTVFKDGELILDQSLDDIKKRAELIF